MKKLLFTLTVTLAFALGSQPSFAEPKKNKATAEATPVVADIKPAEIKSDRPFPMNSRVDAIDTDSKTFTHTNKDGKQVKLVITDKTEIKNGPNPAKFEDIKVGDTISGLRLKKSTDGTEYEVVKITKFSVVEKRAKK